MKITKTQLKKYVNWVGKKTLEDNAGLFQANIYAKAKTLGIMNLGDKIIAQKKFKDEYNASSVEEKQDFWVKLHSLVY